MAQADALVLAQQRQMWSMKAGSKPISHLVREDLKSAKSFYRYKNKKPYQRSRIERGQGKVFINK